MDKTRLKCNLLFCVAVLIWAEAAISDPVWGQKTESETVAQAVGPGSSKTSPGGQSRTGDKKTRQPDPAAAGSAALDKEVRTHRHYYWLTVTVRNPHCPACLKSLKPYLLSQNGVRQVSIASLGSKAPSIAVKVQLDSVRNKPQVIKRLKARDFEIISFSFQ